MIFRLRDRSSGYYLATGVAGVEDRPGWRMIRDRRFAVMIDGDPNDIKQGLAAVYEWFGENRANGFELVAEPIDPGQRSLEI